MCPSSARTDKPPASTEAVRQFMSRLKTRATGPELALRRELHRRGLRYRVNLSSLPGCPDIVFTRARIAIFVDGCFWHGCPVHVVAPKANAEWWKSKLDINTKRDRRTTETLAARGWTVLRVWEHEDPREAADTVQALWEQARFRATD